MVARRIITSVLFIIFLLILELNCNTWLGFLLLILATAGFTALFETRVMESKPFLKVVAWFGFFAVFVGILFLTYPPVKRVPAYLEGKTSPTEVLELRDGKVTGVVDESIGVELYAGIPYAAPPVGDLRWKEPQDPVPWQGVLKADTFAPMEMQPRNLPIYYSLAQIIGYHDYRWFAPDDNYRPAVSEDCLYVNVWKPAGKIENPLPVLVYIHGGSLQTGQPWYADYRGTHLAKEGVVVVNLGYRLGVFGYLALEELQAESPNGTTGNYGLLDQIKALEWVRDNIASFGGDPGNVTLAGESAGSASVSAICTSPLAKGLFRRVVMESSTVASETPPHSYRQLSDALTSGKNVMKATGASTLEELRALPAKKIVGFADTEHHITVDGHALLEDPFVSYNKGNFNEEAALHGYNKQESAAFIMFTKTSLKNYESKVRAYFRDFAGEVLEIYDPGSDKEAAEYWAEIYGAVFFDYPHYAYNRLAVKNGIPAYEYYFTKDNGRIGNWHSGEEVYLYRNIPGKSPLYNQKDRDVSMIFSGYMLNFIKTGDPNGEGLPEFKTNDDGKTLMEIGESIGPVAEKERKLRLYDVLDRMNKK